MKSIVKDMIAKVETIGCTLDKVSIGGVSYIVILTFFFCVYLVGQVQS